MSGLPTAIDIIWDLKCRYYAQEDNQEITRLDLQNDAVKARIQSFMESRGFPPQWAPEEYTTYFEKIFGENKERQRRYLAAKLSDNRVTLTAGNRVIGALLASGHLRVAFTTNFDTVVERAYAEVSGRSLATFHLEGPTAALKALNNEEFPIYCKLHGDFRFDSVKNLSVDLANQDRSLASCMQNAATRSGFIVAGYSGRDESIIALFRASLTQPNPFPNGLFWTSLKGSTVLPAVKALVDEARGHGVDASIVEIETFDALLLRLWRNLPDKSPALDIKVRRTASAEVNIPLPAVGGARPLLRLNALPIRSLPSRCLLVRNTALDWTALREIQAKTVPRLIVTKTDEIWCWGPRAVVGPAFGIDLKQLGERDVPLDLAAPRNLHIKSFVEEAFGSALALDRPLLSRSGRNSTTLIADSSAQDITPLDPVSGVVGKLSGDIVGMIAPRTDEHPRPEKVTWAEAVRLSLVQKHGATWALLSPDIWIWPPRARKAASDFLKERRKNRFNDKFDKLLTAWVHVLIGSDERQIEIVVRPFDDDDEVANPTFSIGSRTAFAQKLRA